MAPVVRPDPTRLNDGPGEIADFVHVDDDGTLRLIHVKAAKGRGIMHSVSATALEVVVGQAVKNSIFLDPERLGADLSAGSPYKASWTSGARVAQA